MRLVIASQKHIGKKLAYPIRTNKGLIFMPQGRELTASIITRIRNLGITYIYIEEKFSDEVVIELIFEDPIKLEILNNLSSFYSSIKKNGIINERLLTQTIRMIIENINLNENAILYKEPSKDEIEQLSLHSLEVAIYCISISKNRRIRFQDIENITSSALLHDIGKLKDAQKPHLEIALDLIKNNATFSPMVYVPILHIHEKIDGTGSYKVTGTKLHPHSQILHIANNYSNLIDKVTDINQRIEMMNMEASSRYDLNLFKQAMEVLYCYPNGLMVELTNSEQGLVCRQNIGFPSRPIIISNEGKIIDLMKEPTLFIKEIID
ncbi:HD-GYP domain-containing protein [Candidatus Epulonipiscium viviparus]|uniref:HD-GYP domain-containing protein n=1 Tax=Candidatus Epulonipiscium viviparus TaxID=420336 RepID=UPI0027381091|nr:HD domain-containing protein [Candidatus Epulopiscium viviparus]